LWPHLGDETLQQRGLYLEGEGFDIGSVEVDWGEPFTAKEPHLLSKNIPMANLQFFPVHFYPLSKADLYYTTTSALASSIMLENSHPWGQVMEKTYLIHYRFYQAGVMKGSPEWIPLRGYWGRT